jgi:hypothetical protein
MPAGMCQGGLTEPVIINWKMDYGQVDDILQRDLDDLRQFASIVAALT